MTNYINQLERDWISAKVPGTTAKKPLNQLRREYYISIVGATSSGTKLHELERRWLAAYIVDKGGTPTAGGDLAALWKDVVAVIGQTPSTYMNENKISFYLSALWDVYYLANEIPTDATPAWTKNYGPATTEEISPAGHLHVVSSTNYLSYLIEDNNFDNSVGTTIQFKVKIISGTTDTAGEFNEWGTGVWFADGTYITEIDLVENLIRDRHGTPKGSTYYEMDTTDDYHIYRVTLKGTALKVYVDGALRLQRVVGDSGDTGTYKGLEFYPEWQGNDAIETSLDYLYYSTDGAFAP